MQTFLSHLLSLSTSFVFVVPFIFLFVFTCLLKRFVLLGSIGFIYALVSLIFGPEINQSFVKKYGVPGTGVITSVKDSSIAINHVRQKDFTGILKTKQGDTIEVSFNSAQGIFEKPDEGDSLPFPNTGEQFEILYIPQHETNFIIPIKNSSAYGLRMVCMNMEKDIQSAQATYKFDPSNPSAKQKYKNVLEKFIQSNCDPARKQDHEGILIDLQ